MRRTLPLLPGLVLAVLIAGCDSGGGVPEGLGKNTTFSFQTQSATVYEDSTGTYTLTFTVDDAGYKELHSDNALPEPATLSLDQIGEAYEGELVHVTGLTIDAGGGDVFAEGGSEGNYDVTGEGGATLTLRIPDGSVYGGEPIPGGPVAFTGVVGQFSFDSPDAGYQLTAIAEGDIEATGGGQ